MHMLTPAPPPFPHRRKPRLYCTRRSTSRRRSRCVSEALHVAACQCSPRRPTLSPQVSEALHVTLRLPKPVQVHALDCA